jgi:hypothetical protein
MIEARPLHPHDKVIHPKGFVVALHLVLDPLPVADNEPVPHEVFKGLVEGFGTLRLFVESPRGIGAIFVFQRRPAFLQRLRP